MIGHFIQGNATGGDIVEGSYEAEVEHAGDEAHSTKVTVKMSVDAASMFNAVAARFKNTRFQLLESHFDALATQMFDALSDSDKASLSKSADLEATEMLKKQGLDTWMVAGAAGKFENENATWRNYLALSEMGYETEGERVYSEKADK